MFRNLFKKKENKSSNFFKEISLNLFTGDLLVTCSLIILGIILIAVLHGPVKYGFCFLIFPILYVLCLWLRINQYFERAYILYHISSYLLVTGLILVYGNGINFQLYYFSICFSIYLYALKPKKYHIYLLFLYVSSFVLVSIIPFNSFTTIGTDLTTFINLKNLVIASISIIVKAIKYVNLKENAVEKYELSYIKSIETEKQLKEKEAIFDLLFNSPVAGAELYTTKKSTEEILSYKANKTLLQLLKISFKKLRNTKRLDLSPKYQSNNKKSIDFDRELRNKLNKEGQIISQWDFYNGEGEIITVEITQMQLDKQDTILSLVLFRDVTKQKQIEKELLESELIYRTLFENVFDGLKVDIYDKTTNKKIDCIINKKMLDLFKTDHYDVEADDYLKYLPELQSNGKSSLQFLKEVRNEFDQKQFLNFRMDFVNEEKQPFTADLTCIEIETENTMKRILIAKDVTELVKKEKIIKKQISSLEIKNIELQKYIESNKQLELFAYKASHDLRSPIYTIGKFVQILKAINSQKLNKQSNEYLDFIETSADNLILLIEDLLQFSKISNKKFNIKKINPKTTIQFVLSNLKPKIEACSATIKINDLPDIIDADEIKFFTLIQNLIANAINYRKPNQLSVIEISSEVFADHFQFNITDNGLGIKEEHQTKIFEIYETFNNEELENITLTKQKGNGIGLSICLKVVELHKGSLWVNSVYGKGSTFSFTISKNLNQIVNN